MPDWTYVPLRSAVERALGVRRARLLALALLQHLCRTRAGRRVVGWLAQSDTTELRTLGVRLPDWAPDAEPVMLALGAAYVRAHRSAGEVTLVEGPGAPDQVTMHDPAPDGGLTLAPSALTHAGPAVFQRVHDQLATRSRRLSAPGVFASLRQAPWRWPGWCWAFALGLGMVAGAIAAGLVTLGPVLLAYDQNYLAADTGDLSRINTNLVGFLQHDRLTLAGTMVATGVLYTGLAVGGMRRGYVWARRAVAGISIVGFPTLLYFLRFGFFDPLHGLLTVILLPLALLACLRPLPPPTWRVGHGVPERLHRRAVTGQLLIIMVGLGLAIGGVIISVVGLTSVFVPSDLTFLRTTSHAVHEANPHLTGFIAHDRSGFGGCLAATGVGVLLTGLWGWRPGSAWVWWTLLLAALPIAGATLGIHAAIGYTDAGHLAPVILAAALTGVGLTLARPYLCAR